MKFTATLRIGAIFTFFLIALIVHNGCTSNSNPTTHLSPTGPAPTATPTITNTPLPCGYPGNTCTPTVTSTFTKTSTATITSTYTISPTLTTTPTISFTSTVTVTPTITNSATITFTVTPTNTPTVTNTSTDTPASTFTSTPTATNTPSNALGAAATLGSSSFFVYPAGIQYDGNGHLWIVDQNNNSLQEWAGNNPVTAITTFNAVDTFSTPWGNAIDSSGNIYVADSSNGQVEVFNSAGIYQTAFGNSPGHTELANSSPTGVAIDPSAMMVYVLSYTNSAIYVYSMSGLSPSFTYTYTGSNFSGAGTAPGNVPVTMNDPLNLCLDSSGNIWVADWGNARIAEYSSYSNSVTYMNSVTDPNLAIAFSPSDLLINSNKIYVTDDNNSLVLEFDYSTLAEVGQFGVGILDSPEGIATDGSGNFYVTDSGNSQIVEFN